MVAGAEHGQQPLHELEAVLGGARVVEGDALLQLGGLGVGEDEGVGEEGPLVVGPQVGEVNVGVDGDAEAQAVALPAAGAEVGARDLEGLEGGIIKLHINIKNINSKN